MDDASHALAAIGTDAIPALIDLLAAHDDEWSRVNAAFALGEMDHAAGGAVPALTRALADDSHFVVRTAADSLGTIAAAEAAGPLGRLLHQERPGWDTPLVRGWSIRDQVRFNAATSLARLGSRAAHAESDLIAALDDPCGQVTTVVLAALRRLGTPSALDAAFSMLTAERWDPSLTGTHRF
ncbi:MAG: HEAT repeat domain-containing protein [Spirochaetaceae bacterium]|nr:HEAT repeat domain-containing protein [Spirochaetaceae bacterium]